MFWIDISSASVLVGCDKCGWRKMYFTKESGLAGIRDHRDKNYGRIGTVVSLSEDKNDARVLPS